MVFSRGCSIFRADSASDRVIRLTILSAYRPIQCGGNCDSANTSRLGSYYLFADHCNVEKCSVATSLGWASAICLWTKAYVGKPVTELRLSLFSDQCRIIGEINAVSLSGSLLPAFRPCWIMGEIKCCLLVWVSSSCFQTLQDNGGDKCCLLVWVSSTSFQTLLDNGGDGMLSPCLGLYYLLSGLRRILGEMYAVSLSGSLLPAFRPCWIMGEMFAVSLSGSSTTSFQTLLDNGGDVCRLLVSSPVFTMAS